MIPHIAENHNERLQTPAIAPFQDSVFLNFENLLTSSAANPQLLGFRSQRSRQNDKFLPPVKPKRASNVERNSMY